MVLEAMEKGAEGGVEGGICGAEGVSGGVSAFLPLLGMFRRSSIAHVLGFKFSMYHRVFATPAVITPSTTPSATPSETPSNPSNPSNPPHHPTRHTPVSLYMCAAVLVSSDVIPLHMLLPYLMGGEGDSEGDLRKLSFASFI